MKKSHAYSETSITDILEKPSLGARVLIGLVYLYRVTLSPIIGNSCRYYPTCSQYMIGALSRYGAFRGSIMGAKRLLRCHPWHEGGYDPVPLKQDSCHKHNC